MVGAIHTKVVDEAKYLLQLSLHQWSDVNCDLKVVNNWESESKHAYCTCSYVVWGYFLENILIA